MRTLRVCLALFIVTVMVGAATFAGGEEIAMHLSPLVSDGDKILINDKLATQMVFVERDKSGQVTFLVPRSTRTSEATWVATVTWVSNNRAQLQRVLSNALLDSNWDAEAKRVGEILYLNARLHEWMQESGAYDEIGMSGETSRQKPTSRKADLRNDPLIEKGGCPPMCTGCQSYVCIEFYCRCEFSGTTCCIIDPGQ